MDSQCYKVSGAGAAEEASLPEEKEIGKLNFFEGKLVLCHNIDFEEKKGKTNDAPASTCRSARSSLDFNSDLLLSDMSLSLVATTLCTAAMARRSSASWGRIAALTAAASPLAPTLALLQSNDKHLHRRCFAHDRDPPLRRTTTNDIVGGRSTIGVFTPITAALWIARIQRSEGATLPPKPAEGPLPPSASAVTVSYNFTTDAQLRELYRNP